MERPVPLDLRDIEFFVVTEDNLQEFFSRLRENKGEVVFVAIRVNDYERLAYNMAELKRYIKQQKSLIVYYETLLLTEEE